MRDEGCSEKLISDTRSAYMIIARLKSTSDKEAMKKLACLEISALERAMWLLRTEQETVLSMRGQQNAVLEQVMEVQEVIDGLLKAQERADAARKKIEQLDSEDERTAAAMVGSRPTQFEQPSPVNPEDVFQRAAFDVLPG